MKTAEELVKELEEKNILIYDLQQQLNCLESINFIFHDAKVKCSELLSKKNNFTITIDNLELFCWPQTFGSTNPFGPGGNAMTTHTVFCYRNTFHNDCVLILLGRFQYRDVFTPSMQYKI